MEPSRFLALFDRDAADLRGAAAERFFLLFAATKAPSDAKNLYGRYWEVVPRLKAARAGDWDCEASKFFHSLVVELKPEPGGMNRPGRRRNWTSAGKTGPFSHVPGIPMQHGDHLPGRRTSRRRSISACSRALNNVAKYAEGDEGGLILAQIDGHLRFAVSEPGVADVPRSG